MQVAGTLWHDIKSQKISEHRIRLKWTKCSPRTKPNQFRTGYTSVIRQGKAQTSPTPSSWGRLEPWVGRPTTWSADQPMGPTALIVQRGSSSLVLDVGSTRQSCCTAVAPSYKYKGGGRD